MSDPRFEVVGLIRVLNCCLFTWREATFGGTRTVEISSEHCENCIAEVKKIGPGWKLLDLRIADDVRNR
jgi:hypothetical protein